MGDGGVVKIITVEGKGSAELRGDIIGMPHGIRRSDQVRHLGLLNRLGCICGAVFQIAAFVLTVFAYRWVVGSWERVWLFVLSFAALFLPGIIIAIVAGTIWPSEHLSFPSSSTLPSWFRSLTRRGVMYSPMPPYHRVWDDEEISNQQPNDEE